MNVTQPRTFGHKSTKRLLLAPSNDGCRKTYLFDFKKYYLPTYLIFRKNKYYLLRAFRKHRHIYHVSMFYSLFIELIEKYQISTSNLLDLWDFLITNKCNVKQAVLQF